MAKKSSAKAKPAGIENERGKTPAQNGNDLLIKEALDKYKELYTYSTDVLLKENERFNRADDKASKYSTMFVFLLGIVTYFDKWIFDKLQWPDFPVRLPQDSPLAAMAAIGLLALCLSAAGWFLSNHAIKLRHIVSRPLNQEVLDFFENQSLLNFYYGFARENSKAYELNKQATDRKYFILKWACHLMQLVMVILIELFLMYCLYSWC